LILKQCDENDDGECDRAHQSRMLDRAPAHSIMQGQSAAWPKCVSLRSTRWPPRAERAR
jgi:hypothetical protein